MNQALGVLEELSSLVHDRFHDALKGPGVLGGLRDLAAAVDWTEPLVLGLLASHTALLLIVIAAGKNQAVQGVVLALCFALVLGGERLNELSARKWDEFFFSSSSAASSSSRPKRRTNYFDDESGIFWSALVSAPLLLVMAVQLVLYLRQSWQLMIELKVAQLRAAAREKREAEQKRRGGKTTPSKKKAS